MTPESNIHRLPLAVQTVYADLLVRLQDEALIEHPGTLVSRQRGARAYWYSVRRVGSGMVERYIGPNTPEIRVRIERAKSEGRDAKLRTRQRRDLVRMCAQGGLTHADAQTGKILQALAGPGIFRLRGVLVGTHAFRCYPAILGAAGSTAHAVTEDIDIAALTSVAVALDDRMDPLLGQALQHVGRFIARPSLHREPTA